MKDYSNMSDFEINKAVSTALGMDVSGATEENNIMYGYVDDICNNPSDAWPIIKTNHINIVWAGDEEWFARTVHTTKVFDVNPLRAAMIVYLMIKDEEK